MNELNAKQLIELLNLQPLTGEGGYFRRTYQSELTLYPKSRDEGLIAGTAIYYLITPESFSTMHRLKYDEIYHFYLGDPAEMFLIDQDGNHRTVTLGQDLIAGQYLQFVVPAGTWQGCKVRTGGKWSLLGTTMAPGFDFKDLELGTAEFFEDAYPQIKQVRDFLR